MKRAKVPFLYAIKKTQNGLCGTGPYMRVVFKDIRWSEVRLAPS